MNKIAWVNGPTLTYYSNSDVNANILIVDDHYIPVEFEQLLDSLAVKPNLVITDFFAIPPESKYNVQYWPIWLANVERSWLPDINEFSNDNEVHSCFNFMMFKPRRYRILSLKILEHFKLFTPKYVSNHIMSYNPTQYHSIGSEIYNEILSNSDQRLVSIVDELSKPVQLLHKFYNNSRNLTYNTKSDYISFLYNSVFSNTLISLITETIEPDWANTCNFSEKTLFSITSRTMPLWLGGYKQAELWKSYGFDIFDDYINHNYQYKSTNAERIYYAIEDNLALLTDLQIANMIKKDISARLDKNKLLLNNNIFFNQLNLQLKMFDDSVVNQMRHYYKNIFSK